MPSLAPPSRDLSDPRLPARPASGAAIAPRKAVRRVMPGPDAFDAYDGFVRSLDFLSSREASALIVAGDEVMDNLLTHGEIGEAGVTVLVRKRAGGLTLAFFVRSHGSFAAFAERHERDGTAPPRFDEAEGRWRGLGLSMCRNLTQSLGHRPGSAIDRIFLVFGA